MNRASLPDDLPSLRQHVTLHDSGGEMIDNLSDPFEDAAAAAAATELIEPPQATTEQFTEDARDDDAPEVPDSSTRRRRRGRPRSRSRRSSSTRSRSAAAPSAANSRQSSGTGDPKIEGPPPPTPKVEPIPPKHIAVAIKQLDALIVQLAGTTPIGEEEAEAGGVVFAPIVDHYMPLLSGDGGMWIPAAVWVLATYAPRAIELQQRKRLGAGEAPVGANFRTPFDSSVAGTINPPPN